MISPVLDTYLEGLLPGLVATQDYTLYILTIPSRRHFPLIYVP